MLRRPPSLAVRSFEQSDFLSARVVGKHVPRNGFTDAVWGAHDGAEHCSVDSVSEQFSIDLRHVRRGMPLGENVASTAGEDDQRGEGCRRKLIGSLSCHTCARATLARQDDGFASRARERPPAFGVGQIVG
jgi:hypothetical protein